MTSSTTGIRESTIPADIHVHCRRQPSVKFRTATGTVCTSVAPIVTAAAKPAYDLAFRTLRKRGTLGIVGLPKEDLTFFADDWVVGEYRMIGSAVGTRAEMRELLELAAAGKVRCEVEVHPLFAINEVFSRMDHGEITGRAVIKFSDK